MATSQEQHQESKNESPAQQETGGSGIWYHLAGKYYSPYDTLAERNRKSFGGLLAIPFIPLLVGLLLTGLFVIITADGPVTVARILLTLGVALCIPVCVGGHFWMRCKNGEMSATASAIIFWLLNVGTITSVLCNPPFSNQATIFALLFMSIKARHPHLVAYIIFLLLQVFLSNWNDAVVSSCREDLMLVLPGVQTTSSVGLRFVFQLIGTLMLGVCGLLFNKQINDTETKEAEQQAANQMTFDILRKHRKYDTESVSRILDDREGEGVVNSELIQLFRQMNANLESYKPYLPNYIFNRDQSSSDDSGDDEGKKGGSGVSEDDEDEGNMSESQVRSVSMLGSSHVGTTALSRVGSNAKSSSPSKAPVPYAQTPVASLHSATTVTPQSKRPVLYRGRVSFAQVDWSFARLASSYSSGYIANSSTTTESLLQAGGSSTTTILEEIAELVFKIAKETKASVHSFLGDRLQLSWNITGNVALPETKGAQFLCRLDAALQQVQLKATAESSSLSTPAAEQRSELKQQQQQMIKISAMLCSGKASVHSIITAKSQQQALMVDAPTWMPSVDAGLDLAMQHNCLLMDEASANGSSLEVDACLVEKMTTLLSQDQEKKITCPLLLYNTPTAATVSSNSDGSTSRIENTTTTNPNNTTISSSTFIYRLIREKQREEDEWMYQLQKQNGGGRGLLQQGGGKTTGDLSSGDGGKGGGNNNSLTASDYYSEAIVKLAANDPSGAAQAFKLGDELDQLARKAKEGEHHHQRGGNGEKTEKTNLSSHSPSFDFPVSFKDRLSQRLSSSNQQ